jgi:hypothetical protein
VCAAELEALLAAAERRPDAATCTDRLEALLLRYGYFYGRPPYDVHAANLVVARLRAARGDHVGALAAARRYSYVAGSGSPYLSSYLREEGRLAALTGDREGARRAYRRYLTLRADPEPPLQAEVTQVRTALAQLERRGAGR